MTIEGKPAGRPAPRLDLSGPELKLFVAATLGAAYSAALLALTLGTDADASDANERKPTASEPAARSPRAAPRQVVQHRLRTRSS